MNPLDRPVWSSLSSFHRSFSEGTDQARRFLPDVNLFASTAGDSPESLTLLAALVPPGETIYILQVPTIHTPPGFTLVREAKGVQMVAESPSKLAPDPDQLTALADADAAEMLALALLTNPGPFLPRTHTLGEFIGTRINGRLAAMAGERMRFPGFTEVSGVCTHPDFRGRGLARTLSSAVARRILARKDQPFLHSWKTNEAAISLYQSLGFHLRCEVNVAILKRNQA